MKKLVILLTLLFAACTIWLIVAINTAYGALTAPSGGVSERIVFIPTPKPEAPAERDREPLWTIQIQPFYGMVKQERYVNGKKLTDDEKTALVKIAEAEAGNQGLVGKALVICVVINRAECEYEFEDDVIGVIFEKGQFSPVRAGCRYWTTTPDDECYEALEMVLNGWDESHGALYFEGHKTTDNWHWRNLVFLFQHKGHRFYK